MTGVYQAGLTLASRIVRRVAWAARPLLAQPSLMLGLARVLGLVLVGLSRIAATQLLPIASFLAGALALWVHGYTLAVEADIIGRATEAAHPHQEFPHRPHGHRMKDGR